MYALDDSFSHPLVLCCLLESKLSKLTLHLFTHQASVNTHGKLRVDVHLNFLPCAVEKQLVNQTCIFASALDTVGTDLR